MTSTRSHHGIRTRSTVRRVIGVLSITAFVGAACSPNSTPPNTPPEGNADPGPDAPRTYALGEFPPFPDEPLPGSTVEELQAALDAVVEDGAFTGVTAAVIVADRGSWAGTAGSLDGAALTPDSRSPTHSAGKTVVAAQVLRLVEDGMLGLDDPASDHLPPELGFFDANGATIRQVLAMRSGIRDLTEFTSEGGRYPAERASSVAEVFRRLREPRIRPGSKTQYNSVNYVLLGAIVEHATGRPLAEVLRSDVLGDPALDGLVYTVEDALAADGYGVESTPGSLARWGYELFGGFVLADSLLGEMTDFYQDPCCDMRYGLGVWDYTQYYGGTPAVGLEGASSVATCCSVIRLVAFPEEGMVVSVQANTAGAANPHPYGKVELLTKVLRDLARG